MGRFSHYSRIADGSVDFCSGRHEVCDQINRTTSECYISEESEGGHFAFQSWSQLLCPYGTAVIWILVARTVSIKRGCVTAGLYPRTHAASPKAALMNTWLTLISGCAPGDSFVKGNSGGRVGGWWRVKEHLLQEEHLTSPETSVISIVFTPTVMFACQHNEDINN